MNERGEGRKSGRKKKRKASKCNKKRRKRLENEEASIRKIQ